MLQFIYSGKLDPSTFSEDEPCMSLLRAAHQYDLPELLEACVDALAARMQAESVSELLLEADNLGIEDLKKSCLEFIGRHGSEVQDTDSFVRASKRHPLV